MTHGSSTVSRFVETSEWHKSRDPSIILKSQHPLKKKLPRILCLW